MTDEITEKAASLLKDEAAEIASQLSDGAKDLHTEVQQNLVTSVFDGVKSGASKAYDFVMENAKILMAVGAVATGGGATAVVSPTTLGLSADTFQVVREAVIPDALLSEAQKESDRLLPTVTMSGSGTTGTAGTDGMDGTTGTDGVDGTTGTDGVDGKDGKDGEPGANGIDGKDGKDGIVGQAGAFGLQGVAGVAGVDGVDGTDGATLVLRGVWNTSLAYSTLDVVSHAGGSFSAIQANTGTIPSSDAAIWLPLAQAGTQGLTGADGVQGLAGPTGLTGATGADGIQGLTGAAGIQGLAGATGIQGLTGADGIQGLTGAAGIQGLTGAAGIQGLAGTTGTPGNTVLNGSADPLIADGVLGDFYLNTTTSTMFGPKAIAGWVSNSSLVGITGSQGIQGITGPTGSQGIQGATGSTGPTGLTGSQGVQGVAGIQGAVGATGSNISAAAAYGSMSNSGDTVVSVYPHTLVFGTITGLSSGITASTTTNSLTIVSAGTYFLSSSVVIRASSNNKLVTIFVNGVASTITGRGGATVNSPTFVLAKGVLTVAAGDVITSVLTSSAGDNITVTGSTLSIVSVGAAGAQGVPGTQGVSGTPGADGSIGLTGPQGLTGSAGIQGLSGAAGAQGVGAVTQATAPINPANGDAWYDTTNALLMIFSGGVWNRAVPVSTSGSSVYAVADAEVVVTLIDNYEFRFTQAGLKNFEWRYNDGAGGTITISEGVTYHHRSLGTGVQPRVGTIGSTFTPVWNNQIAITIGGDYQTLYWSDGTSRYRFTGILGDFFVNSVFEMKKF